jgi:hypothetical protein
MEIPLSRLQLVRWTLFLAVPLMLCTAAAQQSVVAPPVELVRQAVQNETRTIDSAKYMFRDHKETPQGSQTKLMVETCDAMAGIVVAINGRPLSPEQRQAEYFREERFVQNPEELKKKQRQEKDTNERITRILKALPDAFLYEYDGTAASDGRVGKPGDDLMRLKFRPNPKYDPPSHVEQVLTGMQGYILVDPHQERIAKIDGSLAKDVGFGWGFLGHLDHGGHFLVEQGEVDNGHWEITRMALALTGKVLLVKSLNIKSTEVFSDFLPVPSTLTFAQGLDLLKKQEATTAENREQSSETHQ